MHIFLLSIWADLDDNSFIHPRSSDARRSSRTIYLEIDERYRNNTRGDDRDEPACRPWQRAGTEGGAASSHGGRFDYVRVDSGGDIVATAVFESCSVHSRVVPAGHGFTRLLR